MLYYLLGVSIIGAVVCLYDKLAAIKGLPRVPERTLFFWALVGGGPGTYAAMLMARHKTLHRLFMWGIPFLILLQTALFCGIYNILSVRGIL